MAIKKGDHTMKKLIAIALTALTLHQSNTKAINYIDNTQPIYAQSGDGHDGPDMGQVATLYTSYNGTLFLAHSSLNYYEVYTDSDIASNSFDPFDIPILSRMYRQGAQMKRNASDFRYGLCTALTCAAGGYGDQGAFNAVWAVETILPCDGIANNNGVTTTLLYRQGVEYSDYKNTIKKGALVNQIQRSGCGFASMEVNSVQFYYYNPIYLKDQKNINTMTLPNFLLATQTGKGTVALTSSTSKSLKYNSIFKTATDATTNTNTGFANSDGTAYYTNCVVSKTLITSTSSTYEYVGAYVQDSITYYVYGTKLSDSTSNDVTTTAANAYNTAQSLFGYIKTS